ncbi:MAG TPA: glutamine--fructose-6-phosphate transaminase (isomerizing) [Candidatus Babeliaceae bacterium]|nr:glutamine--fructose-6-phosphate transaminase (isomerizing) [Candidatus Babeliaceae bacterium]
MCTVVGYVGKSYCRSYVVEALSRLEYRGYDSAGFACLQPDANRLLYLKGAGSVDALAKKFESTVIDGYIGIGHTRWSTHGVVSDDNSHPHFDCTKSISIVHNGIIENFHELKKELEATGHIFYSQTDTETVAHLLESLMLTHQTFKAAIVDLVHYLQGAYAFVCLMQQFPDTMLIIRKRSPLCIGIGDDEMFIASDPLAFAGKTAKVLFLPDESFAFVKKDRIELYDFSGKPLPLMAQEITYSWSDEGKNGYEHFMLKEIYEQKKVIYDTVYAMRALSSRLSDNIGVSPEFLSKLNSILLIGCGSSWNAARIAQFFFEKVTLLPTTVGLGSEFRYAPFFPETQELAIAISQSGETADTLESVRLLNSCNISTVALTNVASSTLVRECSGFLLTQAGPELAVASTKAFSAQLSVLFWLAHWLAYHKGYISSQQLEAAEDDLLVAAEVLESAIENYKWVITNTLAPYYAQFKHLIFIGRHTSYSFALEAALKFKEIAYIFVDCFPAGELKHGTIALLDAQTPVFLFSSPEPLLYQKILSNAQEVKARSGHLLVFAFENQKELIALADQAFVFPMVNPLLAPLAMVGLMQFFGYHIAKVLNRSIDKPRNLAKSVTVE